MKQSIKVKTSKVYGTLKITVPKNLTKYVLFDILVGIKCFLPLGFVVLLKYFCSINLI
jgi:hypothetical protein